MDVSALFSHFNTLPLTCTAPIPFQLTNRHPNPGQLEKTAVQCYHRPNMIITIANQKGGVGKTTTAVTLAHGLALKGYEVLLVDCDPQGQAATFLGLLQEPGLFDLLVSGRPLFDVARSTDSDERKRQGLTIIPGDKRTATASVVIAAEGFRIDILADRLAQSSADYIVIDTAPSVALFQEAALFASDWLVVPVATDYPAAEGLVGVLDTLKAVQDRGGQCQLLGVLPTMYDSVTNESQATLEQLQERYGEAVLDPIHRATILREAAAVGESIWEISPKSRAATQYANLVFKVLDSE